MLLLPGQKFCVAEQLRVREWLLPTADLQGHVLGKFVQTRLRGDDVLGEPTAPATQADEAVFVAAVDQSLGAGAAVAVVDDGLYADAVSNLVIANTLANLFDDCTEFMAESKRHGLAGDGMGSGWAQACAADVLVQVCQWSAWKLEWYAGRVLCGGAGIGGRGGDEWSKNAVQQGQGIIPLPQMPTQAGFSCEI